MKTCLGCCHWRPASSPPRPSGSRVLPLMPQRADDPSSSLPSPEGAAGARRDATVKTLAVSGTGVVFNTWHLTSLSSSLHQTRVCVYPLKSVLFQTKWGFSRQLPTTLLISQKVFFALCSKQIHSSYSFARWFGRPPGTRAEGLWTGPERVTCLGRCQVTRPAPNTHARKVLPPVPGVVSE